MIGGPDEAVQRLDPAFKTLAPGVRDIPRTPGREKIDGTAEHGYPHCGKNGAGHFVKMVHNGIEYGLMAAYAEGMDILARANVGQDEPSHDAETTPLRNPEEFQFNFSLPEIAEVWRRGSVIASWLPDLTAAALVKDPSSRNSTAGSRIPARDAGRSRRPSTRPCRRRFSAGRSTRFQFARRGGVRRQAALRDAVRVRRARRKVGRQLSMEKRTKP